MRVSKAQARIEASSAISLIGIENFIREHATDLNIQTEEDFENVFDLCRWVHQVGVADTIASLTDISEEEAQNGT